MSGWVFEVCTVNSQDFSKNPVVVSVGIPTFNRPDGLRQTLECITVQTYKNLEIIVRIIVRQDMMKWLSGSIWKRIIGFGIIGRTSIEVSRLIFSLSLRRLLANDKRGYNSGFRHFR